MTKIKAGWIGLGNMGIPMAGHLIREGYSLSVFNRTADKTKALTDLGATSVTNPAELIRDVDVVFLMIADDAATKAIFEAEDGLLSGAANGKVIVNMSTVSPAIGILMNKECRSLGMTYIDAPVSGSVRQALDAQLVIMAGGDEQAFHLVKPLLECMGKLVMHIGDTGNGNKAKLAINTLLAIYTEGLAEIVSFSSKHGIATADLLTLLNNAALSNVFTKIKGEALLNDNFQPVFALKHMVKDLKLAADEGMDTPLAQTALETFTAASADHAEEDVIAIARHLRKK